MEMDPQHMEERKKMVLGMCICKSCPTYVECGEAGGYCFPLIGKSGCIKEEKQCTCGKCPVYSKMDLKNMFYCTRGSEKEQKGM